MAFTTRLWEEVAASRLILLDFSCGTYGRMDAQQRFIRLVQYGIRKLIGFQKT